jgi:hypothetical protein
MSLHGSPSKIPLGLALVVLALTVVVLAPRVARAEGVPAVPIPQNPSELASAAPFTGSTAAPNKVAAPAVPQNPFMAPNGRSNLHDDAYMTNTYTWSGPLGAEMQTLSTFQGADCASLTVDQAGRLVSVCVGLQGPRLLMLDPHTLGQLAAMALPPRGPSTGSPFTEFSGGGYFYLDQDDRAVIPTTTGQIWVVAETSGVAGPGFSLERTYDVSPYLAEGDKIISALPDWSGRIWFATTRALSAPSTPPAARCTSSISASRSATRSRWIRAAACSSSPIAPCIALTRRPMARRRSPGARSTPTRARSSRGRPRTARGRPRI